MSSPRIGLHGPRRDPLRCPILTTLSPQAQQETQKAALRYERAVSMHNAAREMVFVAEQGVMADKNRLDPTWQEMLNHATCKVSQAIAADPLPCFPCFFCCLFISLPAPLLSLYFPLQPLLSFNSDSGKPVSCPVLLGFQCFSCTSLDSDSLAPSKHFPPGLGLTQTVQPCWMLCSQHAHFIIFCCDPFCFQNIHPFLL